MKKGNKLLLTASLVSTAMTVGGCRFLPWKNSDQPAYGVPMDSRVVLTPIPEYREDVEGTNDSLPKEEETYSAEDGGSFVNEKEEIE